MAVSLKSDGSLSDETAWKISQLQDWLMTQEHGQAPVSEAAKAMRMLSGEIEELARAAYWLGLTSFDGVGYVFADGE